jgi:UDP-N-acetyl-D-galactosamine dehydrogenase
MEQSSRPQVVAVVGLGYVGLPLAVAFARGGPVLGYDADPERIAELRRGHDRTGEVSSADLAAARGLRLSVESADLAEAVVHVVAVPTPVNDAHNPDLTLLHEATRLVGAALRPGGLVIYESSVYPCATEEECIPLLEEVSGLRLNRDFAVGYSPERINPGDKVNRLDTIRKIISATDPVACERVAALYAPVVTSGLHRAPSIRVAEMSKIIENTQRDIHIALMNELARICHRLDIDTGDVLEAACTKWNFAHYTPGLVGGHCIGVDPYYLAHRAERAGHHPDLILAGRKLNDDMGHWIGTEVMRLLSRARSTEPRVTILGVTFKEDVPDIRNTRVVEIAREIESFGAEVQVADCRADAVQVAAEYGIALVPEAHLRPADAVVLAVAHNEYVRNGWAMIEPLLRGARPVVADVRRVLDRAACPSHVQLWRL